MYLWPAVLTLSYNQIVYAAHEQPNCTIVLLSSSTKVKSVIYVFNSPVLQVIMGGGRKYMLPKNTSDVEYPDVLKHRGTRNDGRNLVNEWIERMKDKVNFSSFLPLSSPPSFICPIPFAYWVQSDCSVTSHTILYVCVFFVTVQKGHYVWNKMQLLSLNPNNVDYLLGEFLVSVSHWSVNEAICVCILPWAYFLCVISSFSTAPCPTPCYSRPLWARRSDVWLGEEHWDWSLTDRDGGGGHQDPEEEPSWILPAGRG